jgi:hypothetical protein
MNPKMLRSVVAAMFGMAPMKVKGAGCSFVKMNRDLISRLQR